MKSRKKIAVIGAGIAGLSCAYELEKSDRFDVSVYEKENFAGGRMASRSKNGLIFDIGADHLCNVYKHMKQYCSELSLKWQKVDFLEYRMIKNGKIIPLSKSIGFFDKIKLGIEYFRKRRAFDFFDLSEASNFDKENAYGYLKKNVGKEVSDYLADAFTSTYQFHGADEIGLGMLFGIVDSVRKNKSDWYLHHLKGGMSALPNALASKLNVKFGKQVELIESEGNGVNVRAGGKSLKFDCVVLACTADVGLKILKSPSPKHVKVLKNTKYSSTVSVSFMVDKAKLPDIAIVWVPKVESRVISGFVNESMKGKDVINKGKTLLNTWLHEDFACSIIDKSDSEIFAEVKKELVKVCPWVQIEDLVNFDLQRWYSAMPKFSQNHINNVAEFLKNGQGDGGIYLCGDYMNAPWTEGALRNGQRTAELILKALL